MSGVLVGKGRALVLARRRVDGKSTAFQRMAKADVYPINGMHLNKTDDMLIIEEDTSITLQESEGKFPPAHVPVIALAKH